MTLRSDRFVRRGRGFVAAVVVVVACTVATSPAGAVDVGCSRGGVALANPYTVAIDGVPTAPSAPGRYGKYWVLVCRDTGNQDYNVFAGLYDAATDGGQGRFASADLNTQFTVSFVPDAGTVPLVAQGHGAMSEFRIDPADSNRVTLTTKPLLYSDIYGSDCGGKSPAECVLEVKNTNGDKASADNIEIRVSIRYAPTAEAAPESFGLLQGMYWSSAAFYFWMRTMCPTMGGSDQPAVSIEVGGPHLRADGTQNFGSVTVVIPTQAVVGCFGAPPSMVAGSLVVSRTVNGATTQATTGSASDVGLQYTVTADDTVGLTIVIPQVTFSKPKYSLGTKSGKSLARVSRSTSAVTKTVSLRKPAGGRLAVVSKTPRVCVATRTAVFGFRKGTCRLSIVTFNKKGAKTASRSTSFRVG